jgi:hypothetical protein
MDAGNTAYLIMVIGAMTVFAAVLAYYSWRVPGDKTPRS